jgi:hypothetical protein
MATATIEPVQPVEHTVTLELSLAEAHYVYQALQLVDTVGQFDSNAESGDHEDPVYEALGDALRAAGLYSFDIVAQVL